MLTYENFITDIFTKRKTFQNKLANKVFDLVKYYILNEVDKTWNVEIKEKNMSSLNGEEKHNIFSINLLTGDIPRSVLDTSTIINLYYTENENHILLVLFKMPSAINFSKLVNILEEYIINILKPFKNKIAKHHRIDDDYYFVPLDKVQSVIDEMRIENLKNYLTEKKYNL